MKYALQYELSSHILLAVSWFNYLHFDRRRLIVSQLLAFSTNSHTSLSHANSLSNEPTAVHSTHSTYSNLPLCIVPQ
jgi:hypothetical protein